MLLKLLSSARDDARRARLLLAAAAPAHRQLTACAPALMMLDSCAPALC